MSQKILIDGSNETQTQFALLSDNEFDFSSFKRTFNIPDTVDSSKINAQCSEGVLNVNLPKHKEALPQPKKLIKIS